MADAHLHTLLRSIVLQATLGAGTQRVQIGAVLVLDVSVGAVHRSTLGQTVHIADSELVSLALDIGEFVFV